MKRVVIGGGLRLEGGVKVKIKKLVPEAEIPFYSRAGDAGLDLVAVSKVESHLYTEYGTGLKLAIPEGHVGYLFPRSSQSLKDMFLGNCVGVVDSNFRGEVKLRFKRTEMLNEDYDNIGFNPNHYEVGDKVAQLIVMPIPEVEFEEVEELEETNRGDKAFGSSGA